MYVCVCVCVCAGRQLWVVKLEEPQVALAWKRNRNDYAKLMMMMLKAGMQRLEAPFNKKPSEGPLAQMQKWLMYSYDFDTHGRDIERSAKRPSTASSAATASIRYRPKPPVEDPPLRFKATLSPRRASISFDPVSAPMGADSIISTPASPTTARFRTKEGDDDDAAVVSPASRRARESSSAANAKVNALARSARRHESRSATTPYHTRDSGIVDTSTRFRLEEALSQSERRNKELERTIGAQQDTISALRRRLDEQLLHSKRLRTEHRVELQAMITRFEQRRERLSKIGLSKPRADVADSKPSSTTAHAAHAPSPPASTSVTWETPAQLGIESGAGVSSKDRSARLQRHIGSDLAVFARETERLRQRLRFDSQVPANEMSDVSTTPRTAGHKATSSISSFTSTPSSFLAT